MSNNSDDPSPKTKLRQLNEFLTKINEVGGQAGAPDLLKNCRAGSSDIRVILRCLVGDAYTDHEDDYLALHDDVCTRLLELCDAIIARGLRFEVGVDDTTTELTTTLSIVVGTGSTG